MPAISVNIDRDHEAFGKRIGVHRLPVIHTTEDWAIDCLERGMQSGATSLMVVIPVKVQGRYTLVLAETSLNAWMMASSAIVSAHASEVEKPGWARLSEDARQLLIPRYAEAIMRSIPTATREQAEQTAAMMLDSLGSDEPPRP